MGALRLQERNLRLVGVSPALRQALWDYRDARGEVGYSSLARRTRGVVSRQVIANLASGATTRTSRRFVEALADVLGRDVETLLLPPPPEPVVEWTMPRELWVLPPHLRRTVEQVASQLRNAYVHQPWVLDMPDTQEPPNAVMRLDGSRAEPRRP